MTRILPWPVEDGFDLELLSLAVDGRDASHLIDRDRRRVSVYRSPPWSRAVFELSCRVAKHSSAEGPVAASIVLTDSATKLRLSAPMTPNDGAQVGSLRVNRSEVESRARMHVSVASKVRAVPDRLLGESVAWTIDFDTPREPPPAGISPIPIVWDSFARPEKGPPVLAAHASVSHYVDLSSPEPVLYLNRDLGRVHDLLMWDGAQTWKRDIRDALAADIASKTLTTLTHAAMAEIERGADGEIGGPFHQWAAHLLERVAEHMEGVSDLEELRAQIADARSTDARLALLQRIGPAVEAMADIGPTLGRASSRAFE